MKQTSIEPVDMLHAGVVVPGAGRPAVSTSLSRFLNANSVLMVAATAAAFGLNNALPVAAAGAATFGWLALQRFVDARRSASRFGAGNTVTFARALLLLTTATLFGRIAAPVVLALLTVNVLMDALDGFLARRYDECSEFGATCDAEVDALFVMIAGLYFATSGGYGIWVLFPGLLRYVHRLVAWAVAGSSFVERPRRYARLMAGAVFVLLLGAVILPAPWQFRTLVVATIVSCSSFAVSFFELARYSGDRPSVQPR